MNRGAFNNYLYHLGGLLIIMIVKYIPKTLSNY